MVVRVFFLTIWQRSGGPSSRKEPSIAIVSKGITRKLQRGHTECFCSSQQSFVPVDLDAIRCEISIGGRPDECLLRTSKNSGMSLRTSAIVSGAPAASGAYSTLPLNGSLFLYAEVRCKKIVFKLSKNNTTVPEVLINSIVYYIRY
jgi:hypothetical protein